MACKKMPTGDPDCPPHIHLAKRIYRMIVKATDGSDGMSGDTDDACLVSDEASNINDDNDDDDKDDNDNNNNDHQDNDDEDSVGDEEEDEDNGGLLVPIDLSFGDASDFAMENESGAAAITTRISSTATSTACSEASHAGKRGTGAQKGGGGGSDKQECTKVWWGGGTKEEEQGITEAIADPSEVTEY